VALGCASSVPGVEGEAEARARVVWICEEWRDYYYNVSTGDFIEWIGAAYEVCYPEDEPISRPEPPDPDYGGGWGTPRDTREDQCDQCDQDYRGCIKRVERGGSRCASHYRNLAHSWCVRYKRKKFGKPLQGDYRCYPLETPGGKPTAECEGPAINDCEESYAQNQPDVTIANTEKINVGHDWWGVGGDQTSTTAWGGSRGWAEGCQLAEQEASETCLANQETCEEAAGGCR
jgi:hypothetical protein